MFSVDALRNSHDPIDTFYEVLQHAWETICDAYDVIADLPAIQSLFESTDLNHPDQAAETVVANMLIEITENTHRFSPWYKLPARSFGLTSIRNKQDHSLWMLAPEAIHKWHNILEPLSGEIQYKQGLIKAIVLIDDFEFSHLKHEEAVVASCACQPPSDIRIKPSVLDQTEITCEACLQPFLLQRS